MSAPMPSSRDAEARLQGEVARLHAVIAQRERELEEAREREQRYRLLVDHAQDVIYQADRGGHFTYFNLTAMQITGYSAEELRGRLYLDLIHPDHRKAAKRFYVRQIRDRIETTYFEYPAVKKDGSVLWLGQHVQLAREGKAITGIRAIARDITERRELEARLREAREHLEQQVAARTAALRASYAVLQNEAEKRRRLARRHLRLMEIAAAINASMGLPDILRIVRDALVDEGGFDRAGVFLYDREQNLLLGAWGIDREGRPEDISHQRYPVLPDDTMPMPRVARGELDYYYSGSFAADFALPPEDVMAEVRDHAILPMRAAGEVVGVVTVDNLLRNAPITEEDIENLLPFAQQAAVAVCNARLFEELRQTQAALAHSEKLRALGALASGVAHNVNNVLAIIMGYAELLAQCEDEPQEVRRCTQIIEQAASQGAEIVRRMQQFARKEAGETGAAFDLAATAREAVELTRPIWHNQAMSRGARIEVACRFSGALWTQGVASEIREVLVNLLTNAADAMPAGGQITVRGFAEQQQAILEVADTGIGMDEATRQRVFEPFFTTKSAAQGTGLGLAVAWGIMNRHRGRIAVQSVPGEGARFRLSLPLTGRADISPAPLAPAGSVAGARILLVEDEERVRESIARILEASGAVVAQAADAREARRWLESHPDGCDLLLSDQGMVGMTGLELLDWARRTMPQIRRALISGWGVAIPGAPETSAAEMILAKPVRRKALVAALAELLAQRREAATLHA